MIFDFYITQDATLSASTLTMTINTKFSWKCVVQPWNLDFFVAKKKHFLWRTFTTSVVCLSRYSLKALNASCPKQIGLIIKNCLSYTVNNQLITNWKKGSSAPVWLVKSHWWSLLVLKSTDQCQQANPIQRLVECAAYILFNLFVFFYWSRSQPGIVIRRCFCFSVLFVSQCQHVTSESHCYKVGNPNWHNLLFSVNRANKAFTTWGRVMVWHQRFVWVCEWVCVYCVWGLWWNSDFWYVLFFDRECVILVPANVWELVRFASQHWSWFVLWFLMGAPFPPKGTKTGVIWWFLIDPECLVFYVRVPKWVIRPWAVSHLIDCLQKQPEQAALCRLTCPL